MQDIPKIKYTHRVNVPHIRKRDNASITHWLRVDLTTDEAVLISAMYGKAREISATEPTNSLFRTAVTMIADGSVSESELLQGMAQWRTRTMLAAELAEADYNRALSCLETLKQPMAAKPAPIPTPVPLPVKPVTIPTPVKVRREYVHEPRQK